MKRDPSEKIDIPNLLHVDVKTHVTVLPSTPEWTDRSWNGRGFFPLDEPEISLIDPEGEGRKKYRRH